MTSLQSPNTAQQSPSTVFNNLIQSHVLYALNNLGVLSYLKENPQIELEKLRLDLNIEEIPLIPLLKAALDHGVLDYKGALYSLSPYGESAYEMIGFFTWAIGGYGDFFASIDKLNQNKQLDIKQWVRGDQVAKGSDECYRHLMQPILHRAIDQIPFSNVADLGCGNAGKLIEFAKLKPEFRGLGIDISQSAINLAKENIKASQLEDRIELHCGNVLDALDSKVCFPDIETVTCFMMFHDLLNIPNLEESLFDKLKRTFPNVRYFLIGDTTAANLSNGEELPIFTSGFELLHQLMKVQLFDKEYYLNFFKKSGLQIQEVLSFGVPNTYLFILKV